MCFPVYLRSSTHEQNRSYVVLSVSAAHRTLTYHTLSLPIRAGQCCWEQLYYWRIEVNRVVFEPSVERIPHC